MQSNRQVVERFRRTPQRLIARFFDARGAWLPEAGGSRICAF
jgi:hypothetical protein